MRSKKNIFKYKWPTIDVTRKSVEETAASIIKIHEIYKNNVNEIILASKSGVRKKILEENQIKCIVEPQMLMKIVLKKVLLKEKQHQKLFLKILAELKANKISQKRKEN